MGRGPLNMTSAGTIGPLRERFSYFDKWNEDILMFELVTHFGSTFRDHEYYFNETMKLILSKVSRETLVKVVNILDEKLEAMGKPTVKSCMSKMNFVL